MGYWNWLYQSVRQRISLKTVKGIKEWYKEWEGLIEVIGGLLLFSLMPLFFVVGWWLVTLGVISCVLICLHGIYVLRER